MPGAPGRIRTRDPLLRRSFHAGGQAAAFLIRAGLLVVRVQLNVSGFHPVLARGWHGWPDRWPPLTGLSSPGHNLKGPRDPGCRTIMVEVGPVGTAALRGLCRCSASAA